MKSRLGVGRAMLSRIGRSLQRSRSAPFAPEAARTYTARDRREQCLRLATACRRIGELFDLEGDAQLAAVYRSVADGAERLLAAPDDHEARKELAAALPYAPQAWLNPKYFDHNGPREPWQDEVAVLQAGASEAALELRSVAYYS